MSKNLHTLLTTAAELRSCGASWEAVGLHVNRSPRTCTKWPNRFEETWELLYRHAQRQRFEEAGNEAMTMLRKMLLDGDGKLKLRAGEILVRYGSQLLEKKDILDSHRIQSPDSFTKRKEPAETDEDLQWVGIREVAVEERQKFERRRAEQGLTPGTEDEFYEQWIREMTEAIGPMHVEEATEETGNPIEKSEPPEPTLSAPSSIAGIAVMGCLVMIALLSSGWADRNGQRAAVARSIQETSDARTFSRRIAPGESGQDQAAAEPGRGWGRVGLRRDEISPERI